MTHIPTPVVDELLRHESFLRALARGLVASPADAEDVTQDAWLSAVSARGAAPRDPRSWLARVARNAALQLQRRERRRLRRELSADPAAAAPGAGEVAVALETQRAVAEAVAALPEPYRTALYLRFYRCWSDREIADELGVPLETARTRIKRALHRLRQRLDREFGGRQRWLAALLPLASGYTVAPTIVLGAVMSHKVLAAALLVVGTVALLWSVASADSMPPELPTPNVAAASSSVVEPAPSSLPPDERVVLAPERVEPAAVEPSLVAGRLRIVDEDGQWWERLQGSLRVAVVQAGDEGRRQAEFFDLEVVDGRFAAPLPRSGEMVVPGLQFEERVAVPTPMRFAVPAAGEVVIEGRFLGAVLLHVIDAQTKTPLHGVEVRSRSGWRALGDDLHPGEHPQVEHIAKNAPSPVALPSEDNTVVYWARAPGYAWGRIDVRHERSGARTVALQPGGAVDVVAAGALPGGAYLRLFGSDAPFRPGAQEEWQHYYRGRLHAYEAPIGAAPLAVEHLLPGPYLARIQAGSLEQSVTLGEIECQVVVGGRTSIAVPITAKQTVRVPLGGTLQIPEELVDEFLHMTVSRVRYGQAQGQKSLHLTTQRMREDPGDARRLAWQAEAVIPGDYWLHVAPVQHRQRFTVPDSGLTDLVVELAEVAHVVVDLRDAVTGDAVAARRAGWSNEADLGLSDNVRLDARIDPRAGTVSFTALAGPVALDVEASGYLPASLELELVPGDNHRVLELSAALGLRIEVREQGALMPLDDVFWRGIKIEAPGGAPFPMRQGRSSRRATFYYQQPGTYRISFPRLEGFAEVPPREVEVTEGLAEVVVDLERS